jgi:hypothetical protein
MAITLDKLIIALSHYYKHHSDDMIPDPDIASFGVALSEHCFFNRNISVIMVNSLRRLWNICSSCILALLLWYWMRP